MGPLCKSNPRRVRVREVSISRKLCISAGGGLGDQVCLEPVLRHMIERWCHRDDIQIVTPFPEIFSHLPVSCFGTEHRFSEERLFISTAPAFHDPSQPSFNIIHPVDYISLRLLRRTLPLASRAIRLELSEDALARARSLLSGLPRPVLVHPGRSWQSKTLPRDVWQAYVDALLEAGLDVVVIGKELAYGQSAAEQRGTLELDTRHCLDLTGKLSLRELFALISLAPALISNDSGPVHVAGAFDNWIGIIATAKRPDYILPYRQGSPFHKARALESKALYESLEFNPLERDFADASEVPEHALRQAAPASSRVVEFALSCFQ
jgi:hypothetical protein